MISKIIENSRPSASNFKSFSRSLEQSFLTVSTISFLFQLTLLNAGRKYLGLNSLSGKVFLTSGLGGMSGAQPKVRTCEILV